MISKASDCIKKCVCVCVCVSGGGGGVTANKKKFVHLVKNRSSKYVLDSCKTSSRMRREKNPQDKSPEQNNKANVRVNKRGT